MSEHLVQWTTPAPLWSDLIGIALPGGLGQTISQDHDLARAEFQSPALLRFTRDTFMEEFLTLLENAPSQLRDLRAFRETWRGPAASVAPTQKRPQFERPFALRKALAEQAQARQTSGRPIQRLKDLIRPDTPGTDVFGSVPQSLKLYQPAHMRHYLVSACLVCQTTGLPDRAINSAAQEHVGFVVRRLIPHSSTEARTKGDPYPADEYAFVKEASGTVWKNVGPDAKSLLPGEEQQALFPVSFDQADGRRRRLFAGVVPVGRQAAYLGAPRHREPNEPPPTGYTPLRPGEQLFITQVTEPWKRLVEMNFAAENRIKDRGGYPTKPKSSDAEMDADAKTDFIKTTREQIQATSWLILLDFARLLQEYLPDVWNLVKDSALPAGNSPTGKVAQKIRGTKLSAQLQSYLQTQYYAQGKIMPSLDKALLAIVATPKIAQDLEAAVKAYDRGAATELDNWPPFLFPFGDPADPDHPEKGDVLPPFLPGDKQEATQPLDILVEHVDRLLDSIHAALDPNSTKPSPPEPVANQPVLDPNESWFVLRCVMERPECDPRLAPAVISDPTAPFQMAGFFDPDAPARPIRISLPVDTTPAGLRKFDKNTAFLLSDMLCGQVNRAKGMTLGDLIRSVLPWPLHKDLSVPDTGPCADNIGMICSLSIPIITICALILLMIIVSLLDIIFHWLPFFIMCFPLPKFKAKEA